MHLSFNGKHVRLNQVVRICQIAVPPDEFRTSVYSDFIVKYCMRPSKVPKHQPKFIQIAEKYQTKENVRAAAELIQP